MEPVQLPAIKGDSRRAGALAVAAMALVAACSERPLSWRRCAADPDCGGAGVCMSGSCLPRVTGRGFALEIVPRADSAAALTELPYVLLGPDVTNVEAETKLAVTGMTVDVDGGLFAPDGHLSFEVPSRIPGRPRLQIETELARRTFSVAIPGSLLGAEAQVWVTPAPMKTDRPPVRLKTRFEQPTVLTLPRSAELLTVRGRLIDALSVPMTGFVARATVGGKLVSNVATTDATGSFALLVAAASLPDDNRTVTLDLAPPASNNTEFPRLVCRDIALPGANALDLKMPAFVVAMPLRFRVLAGEVNGKAVADASVRFRTEIPAPPNCAAVVEREKLTDANGEIEVSLIPGSAPEARLYSIMVVPPSDSAYSVYGARCLSDFPVIGTGSAQEPRYGADLWLGRKVKLSGAITGSDGQAAVGVNVTATRLAAANACAAGEGVAGMSATTTRAGQYDLLLEPGTYRLDIEPPTGAPLPRLTLEGEAAVEVTTDTIRHVALPPGEVVEVYVYSKTEPGATETPVPSAAVHVYESPCADSTCDAGGAIPSAPALRAQARTDAHGVFRAVLPLTPALPLPLRLPAPPP